jgi:hypothetical protein
LKPRPKPDGVLKPGPRICDIAIGPEMPNASSAEIRATIGGLGIL